MNIYCDVDDTICSLEEDYEQARPYVDRIAVMNKLFEKGHTITYWSARGTVTGKDWKKVTEDQLSRWGVKYHYLLLGKPAFDIFVDDKAINEREFFGGLRLWVDPT